MTIVRKGQIDHADSLGAAARVGGGVVQWLFLLLQDRPTGQESYFFTLLPIDLGGHDIALQAARNHRALRALGGTVRKTIDTVFATHCIAGGYWLLHNDRELRAVRYPLRSSLVV